jgi:hypothetical protein
MSQIMIKPIENVQWDLFYYTHLGIERGREVAMLWYKRGVVVVSMLS